MAVQFQKIDLFQDSYEEIHTYGSSLQITEYITRTIFFIDQTTVGQDTNTWYQFHLWVSNPGEHSLWIRLELGQRYGSWANTESYIILPPKSGWNLFVPGLILRGVKYNDNSYPYYYQEVWTTVRDIGTGYMCGYIQKTPALPYTTVGEGLFALSNSAYDPGYADEPCGAAIQMLSPQEGGGSYKRVIHTAVSGTSYCDEVWLWACCAQYWGGGNQSAYCHRQLYIEWGDTDTAKVSMFLVPPDAGWVPVIQGAILQNGAQIRGWAENYADAEINVSGYVWRKEVGT